MKRLAIVGLFMFLSMMSAVAPLVRGARASPNPGLFSRDSSPYGSTQVAAGVSSTTLNSNDVIILNNQGGSRTCGNLYCGSMQRLDQATGLVSQFSDFGNASTGAPGLSGTYDMTLDATGGIVVTSWSGGTSTGGQTNGGVFRVDPSTGSTAILSDFGNPAQGWVPCYSPAYQCGPPINTVVDASGNIWVLDLSGVWSSCCFGDGLFRIDPATGMRTVVSNGTDSSQGTLLGYEPESRIAAEASGNILLTTSRLAPYLLMVDPATGSRTILSNFADPSQGPTGTGLSGLTVESSGSILVAGTWILPGNILHGAVFRVDPSTGSRTVISDLTDSTQGQIPWVGGPGCGGTRYSLSLEPSGQILLSSEGDGCNDAVVDRVDPVTGFRTLLADFPKEQIPAARVEKAVLIHTRGDLFRFDWADFDNTNKVDIVSIAHVAICFDKTPDSPAWTTFTCAYWDFYLAGKITILDVALVAFNFGRASSPNPFPGQGQPAFKMGPSWKTVCGTLPTPDINYCNTLQ